MKCQNCGVEIVPIGHAYYQRVEGWAKQGTGTLRARIGHDQYRCVPCVEGSKEIVGQLSIDGSEVGR
jgi:hypothetical protein